MAINILTIFSKNCKLMLNSKLSSLILILGPLIIIMIIGLPLQDPSLKNINAGIVSSGDEFSIQFISKLKERGYNTLEEPSIESCKNNVINGKNHVCISIRKSEMTNIIEGKLSNNYDIKLHVDFSKQRIVWGIIGSISGLIDLESSRLAEETSSTFNSKIDATLTFIDENENNLIMIDMRLDQIRENINNIIDETEKINSKKDLINTRIIHIKEDLQDIKNLGIIDNTLLTQAEYNLNQLETELNSLQDTNLIENSLRDAKDQVSNLRNKISDIENSIEKLSEELEGVKKYDLSRLSNPVRLTYESASGSIEGESNKKLEFIDYFFPTFLIIFIIFSSIILSTTLTVKERSSKAYIRNMTSKIPRISNYIGNFITYLVLIGLQITVIILVSLFLLNISLSIITISTISEILIAIVLFISIGIAIGQLFNSQESALGAAITIALIFTLFSSIIIPTEILPQTVSKIINLTPSVILETSLRQSSVFNLPFTPSILEIISLIIVFLISISLTYIGYHKSKEKQI
jgi:ABC-type multidrug transport system permease subunit